jgi:hypothetical protein
MMLQKLMTVVLGCQIALASQALAVASNPGTKLLSLPERPQDALSGSQFIQKIKYLPASLREKKIVEEILRGNIPNFQRQLVPVERKILSGVHKGKKMKYWVLPDYLAIGSDHDFVRVPLNMVSINTLARNLNLSLPTTAMVDDIYAQAQVKLKPMTLPSGKEMCSVQYFHKHNTLVQSQLQHQAWKPGQLVAGHKKDVVQSSKLVANPKAVAIYGWHQRNNSPIQPLSTVHGAEYADYSHGVRFVSNIVEVNNTVHDLRKVLNHKLSSTVAAKPESVEAPHS